MKFFNFYLFLFIFQIGVVLNPLLATETDPIVAKVNQHEIRLSYIKQKAVFLQLDDQSIFREQFDQFVDSVIQEEVLLQSVISTDFQNEEKLRDEIKSFVVNYLIQKYVKDRIHVTEEEIQKYYEENNSVIRGEHVRIRQILLKTKEECEQLKQKIDSEKTFSQMAQEYSLDKESASDGGMLGYFMRQPGTLGFEEQWFDLQLGEMNIYESPAGCHLVRKVGYVAGETPPLERVRERIVTVLTANQEIALLREFIQKVSKKVMVKRTNESLLK